MRFFLKKTVDFPHNLYSLLVSVFRGVEQYFLHDGAGSFEEEKSGLYFL